MKLRMKLKKILNLSSIVLMGVSAIPLNAVVMTPTVAQAEVVTQTRKETYSSKISAFKNKTLQVLNRAKDIKYDQNIIEKQFLDFSALLTYQEKASQQEGYAEKYQTATDIHGNMINFERILLASGAAKIDEANPIQIFDATTNHYYSSWEDFGSDSSATRDLTNVYFIPNLKLNPDYKGRLDFTGDFVDNHGSDKEGMNQSFEIGATMLSLRNQENQSTDPARIFFEMGDHELAYVLGETLSAYKDRLRKDITSTKGITEIVPFKLMREVFLPKKDADKKGVANPFNYDSTTNTSFSHINLNRFDIANGLARLKQLIENKEQTVDRTGDKYRVLNVLKANSHYSDYFDDQEFSGIDTTDLDRLIKKAMTADSKFKSEEAVRIHQDLNLITRAIMFLKTGANEDATAGDAGEIESRDYFLWYERTLAIPDSIGDKIGAMNSTTESRIKPGFYNEAFPGDTAETAMPTLSDNNIIYRPDCKNMAHGLFVARQNNGNPIEAALSMKLGWNQFYGHDTLKEDHKPEALEEEGTFSVANDHHNHNYVIDFYKAKTAEDFEKFDLDQLTIFDYTNLVHIPIAKAKPAVKAVRKLVTVKLDGRGSTRIDLNGLNANKDLKDATKGKFNVVDDANNEYQLFCDGMQLADDDALSTDIKRHYELRAVSIVKPAPAKITPVVRKAKADGEVKVTFGGETKAVIIPRLKIRSKLTFAQIMTLIKEQFGVAEQECKLSLDYEDSNDSDEIAESNYMIAIKDGANLKLVPTAENDEITKLISANEQDYHNSTITKSIYTARAGMINDIKALDQELSALITQKSKLSQIRKKAFNRGQDFANAKAAFIELKRSIESSDRYYGQSITNYVKQILQQKLSQLSI